MEPGTRIRRGELHDRYGGSRQDGISPSRKTPNIFIFTDPRSGEQHGYYDRWTADDTFHYTGRGQRGDQTLTSGNLAIVNHVKDGRALPVFQGAKGLVEYMGEFVLDDQDPYDWGTAHSTGGGRAASAGDPLPSAAGRPTTPPPRGGPAGGAVPATRRDHRADPFYSPDAAGSRTPQDPGRRRIPDAAGRGLRAHHQLQNRLAEFARAAGWAPRDPAPINPEFDLAWETADGIVVVEVKELYKGQRGPSAAHGHGPGPRL